MNSYVRSDLLQIETTSSNCTGMSNR